MNLGAERGVVVIERVDATEAPREEVPTPQPTTEPAPVREPAPAA